jgi:hypothetical protein
MSAIIALDGHNGQIISLFERGEVCVGPYLAGWHVADDKAWQASLGKRHAKRR